ncbi:hypothetical protein QTO34_015128 [Cnephaeus nilssonii]|uniref:Zinc finger ZPR1-type domain-containing protein n=1 Tax=Cnephaeus nilssonii TaxID=3371016 RepID=A0AA40I3N5_CNENI|nr:hypothetical protein QTO34_015128 [Eptesicus nilssonii]
MVSSFCCEHCGWNNTEVQSLGRIQGQGVHYTQTVRAAEDMNREVVKPGCHHKDSREEMLELQAEAPEEKPQEEDLRNEVLPFNTNCPECNAPAQTNMKLVQTPFKEVIIMATNCEYCRHPTQPMSVEIPELEFELGMAVFGGKFTTLEGLLKDIPDLVTKNPFTLGDSSNPGQMDKLQEFSQKLDQIIEGKMKAHLIMNDPAGNSYLQNVYAPEDDLEMKVGRYKCTFDQNEELGLNDMKMEGYEKGLAPR